MNLTQMIAEAAIAEVLGSSGMARMLHVGGVFADAYAYESETVRPGVEQLALDELARQLDAPLADAGCDVAGPVWVGPDDIFRLTGTSAWPLGPRTVLVVCAALALPVGD